MAAPGSGAEIAAMREPSERSELIRAVKKRGEAVSTVAGRLGVPASTAYRWMRIAEAEAAPVMKPTFVEVVAERAERSTILVRIGVAEIEVRAGFDGRLLREVAEALGGGT
jgi:transposase-like protein